MEYLSAIKLNKGLPENTYLNSLAPVRYLMQNELTFDRPVTFFVGENGVGKSTLLEAIAVCCGFNPEGGSRNFRFSTEDTHSGLGEYLTPIRKGYNKDGFFLRAESFYNVASYLDNMKDPTAYASYGGVSLHEQSHVKSVSRFARNTVDGLKTCEELRAIGVGVFFEDCGLNSIDPENDMTLAVLFSVAQKESQTKSHNVKWGIRQRQKAGKWFCNAHFGYDKIERGLIINEQEAATVRYIFHLYTEEDYSVHGITQLLNKDIEKYPTKQGKVWSRQQISGMLRNSIYVGMYRSHVEEKQGYKATDPVMQVPEKEQYIHELPELRIIDDDTWDKAVQILKAREARYSTVHLKGKNTNRHLLSTMLFCKDCGVAYTRQKRHGGLKKDGTRSDLGYFWGCRNYAQYGTLRCNNKYGINEDEAEKQVREAISQLQQDIREHDGGALLTNFKAYLKIMYELDHEDSSIEAVKAELKKIERKKDIILEDRMEGLMSKELYQKEVKALNEQAEELELRIKSDRMYDETIKQEWSRYNKYIKRVLALDPDSLNNGDLKQVYNKIYVGVADVEGKARPRKYLIFSYSLMGYSVEEIIQMYYDKGYADENTVVNIKIN